MSLYRVHLLPAQQGDCILIEYGRPERPHRVLIDGGIAGTWKHLKPLIEALPVEQRRFDLLVVTHIDQDHIEGALSLFKSPPEGLSFDDIWFNGYKHLEESDLEDFGPLQGEVLTRHLWTVPAWNQHFGRRAVVVPDTGPLPTRELPGGMRLTLLSPTRERLKKLRGVWAKKCEEAGLVPEVEPHPPAPEGLEVMGGIDVATLLSGRFKEDDAEANGSSIAFIAEHGGRSVLFGADAHPSVLCASIARLAGGRAKVDAFKLPHHGSRKNVSRELLALVDTPRYLFSTSGSRYRHPDREAVARVVANTQPAELWFNYRSAHTEAWDSDALRGEWRYTTRYPPLDAGGITLDLS
ncbi:MBL fold metallo-hydrolase [Myxococcus sp. K15C18031901]|uniref:ComEC/Rec2 family competence protein n=1 Tax=Myxococcus dinghuensis TaxID=2906761 RepID=UPI0020A6F638|nr:MBL fold metallo-hydrolase [Myxococcus dinghuensis]MCP3100768.1 MBL fold metallo-hydrolase [Myxococcus dinghuensis]